MRTTYPQNDNLQQPSFLGRNGYFHSQGLEITRMACGLISLQPITTKGKTARCTIELPGDPKTLREIAQHLLDLASIATLEPVAERNEPLAAEGLTSYRYKGRYGYIMIGATDNADALREARRSTEGDVIIDNLEVWNGQQYRPA